MFELWHLKRIDWLEELPPGVASDLRQHATFLRFRPGATIFEPVSEPHCVFLLETGLVKMFRRSTHGDEVILGYIQPGEVFGEFAAFSDRPRESFAEAVEHSSVIKVERSVFADAIKSRPEIVFSVAKQIGDRFKQIESRIEDLIFRSARERIARIILQLADEFGKAVDDHLLVDLRLTHAELAKLAGTSRPTASIAIGELEDEETIVRSNGKLIIRNMAALRREADNPPESPAPAPRTSTAAEH